MAMQQSLGQAVRWVDPDEAEALNPTLAPGSTLGGTFLEDDGYIHPPRNVLAYTVALAASGVEVLEQVAVHRPGHLRRPGGRGRRPSQGTIATGAVVLTGGPQLADVGVLAGTRIPAGGVRHQVAVTEPSPDLDPARLPMVFDVTAGLYWRPEEGGLLFGMSNPDEPPGRPPRSTGRYLETDARAAWPSWSRSPGRSGCGGSGPPPSTTPPTTSPSSARSSAGTARWRAPRWPRPGGHGMMWGPGVSRAAADLALTGTTDVVDAAPLGLDRFDEHGRSRLDPDPIALPFPERTTTP